MSKHKHHYRPDISLLIPFRTDGGPREEAFRWLIKYWREELPDAEIVIGHSSSRPFSKTEALNNAARRSHGKVLVILDADAYIEGRVIAKCAARILEDIEYHLWFVPYRRLYRLTGEASQVVIASDPADPFRYPDPPPSDVLDGDIQKFTYGHRFAALTFIIPREAYKVLGCFDERFKGWGSEDVCMLRALDTLYGKHKTTNNAIFHLWHPAIGTDYRSRAWIGQQGFHPNDKLAMRYHRATRHPAEMRGLVNEGCAHRRKRNWFFHFLKKIFDI